MTLPSYNFCISIRFQQSELCVKLEMSTIEPRTLVCECLLDNLPSLHNPIEQRKTFNNLFFTQESEQGEAHQCVDN